MKNELVVWQHKEMCVASNTSGRFAYAHLNDTVRQDSAVVVRLGSSWWGMVLVRRSRCGAVRYAVVIYGMLRRSRLGSFRKDSIWRSWVRSGGQGRAAFGGAWRVQVGQGGLGEVRRGRDWRGLAGSGLAVQARHGAVCCGAMRSGSARLQPTVRGHADPSPL